MANILLTTDCQRNCRYCFAKIDREKNMSFSWENFITATNFIASSGYKLVNLLGGEPTLHPEFTKFLEYLIVNDFIIQVFTNGILSEDKISDLNTVLKRNNLKPKQLRFSVNINGEDTEEFNIQKLFLSNFNELSFPAFTIHEKNIDLLFLVNIIRELNLDHSIRIGMAMPVIGGKNKYLPIDHYKDVSKDIVNLCKNSDGISISLDCGFPLCMFDINDIIEISKDKKNDLSFICGQPLDIYPDLTVTNCYPLSMLYKTKIKEHNNISDLYKHFNEGFMTPTGIFGKKCTECQFFRKVCFGGCLGFYKSENQGDNEWKKLSGKKLGT